MGASSLWALPTVSINYLGLAGLPCLIFSALGFTVRIISQMGFVVMERAYCYNQTVLVPAILGGTPGDRKQKEAVNIWTSLLYWLFKSQNLWLFEGYCFGHHWTPAAWMYVNPEGSISRPLVSRKNRDLCRWWTPAWREDWLALMVIAEEAGVVSPAVNTQKN